MQRTRASREHRQHPRQLSQAFDVRHLPHVALQNGRDVGAEPLPPALFSLSSERLWITAADHPIQEIVTGTRVLQPGSGERELGGEEKIDEILFDPFDLSL